MKLLSFFFFLIKLLVQSKMFNFIFQCNQNAIRLCLGDWLELDEVTKIVFRERSFFFGFQKKLGVGGPLYKS